MQLHTSSHLVQHPLDNVSEVCRVSENYNGSCGPGESDDAHLSEWMMDKRRNARSPRALDVLRAGGQAGQRKTCLSCQWALVSTGGFICCSPYHTEICIVGCDFPWADEDPVQLWPWILVLITLWLTEYLHISMWSVRYIYPWTRVAYVSWLQPLLIRQDVLVRKSFYCILISSSHGSLLSQKPGTPSRNTSSF